MQKGLAVLVRRTLAACLSARAMAPGLLPVLPRWHARSFGTAAACPGRGGASRLLWCPRWDSCSPDSCSCREARLDSAHAFFLPHCPHLPREEAEGRSAPVRPQLKITVPVCNQDRAFHASPLLSAFLVPLGKRRTKQEPRFLLPARPEHGIGLEDRRW